MFGLQNIWPVIFEANKVVKKNRLNKYFGDVFLSSTENLEPTIILANFPGQPKSLSKNLVKFVCAQKLFLK